MNFLRQNWIAIFAIVVAGAIFAGILANKSGENDSETEYFFDQSNKQYDTVGALIAWKDNDWHWVSHETNDIEAYLSGLPDAIEREKCKMCKFRIKAKLNKAWSRSVPPVAYILKTLEVKKLSCG